MRDALDKEQAMQAFQPTLSQSLDAISSNEPILFHGFACIDEGKGNSVDSMREYETYYLVTEHAVHYRAEERGLFKRHDVPRALDLGAVDWVDVEDASANFGVAVLRFSQEKRGEIFHMMFTEKLSALRSMSPLQEAMRFATRFGGRQWDRSPFFEGWLHGGPWHLG